MIFRSALLLVLINVSADAFTVTRPKTAQLGKTLHTNQFASITMPSPKTCLWAEAKDSESEKAESPTAGAEEIAEGEEAAGTPEATAEGEAEGEEPTSDAASAASDILSSPAFLKRKLEVLQSDIAKTDEELEVAKVALAAGKAEWGSQLDDLQKEYKNIQARMSTQNKAGDTQAILEVTRQMLEVLDNFDRAFGAINAETDEEKAIEAEYKAVYQQVLDTFENLGIKPVETVGKEFDYEVHQAVMQRPSDDFEEGIVCDELQRGYILGDVLVRAAMVAVAA